MSFLRPLLKACVFFLIAMGSIKADGLYFAMALPAILWLFWPRRKSPDAPESTILVQRKIEKVFLLAFEALPVELKITNTGERLEYIEIVDELPQGAILISGSNSYRGSMDKDALIIIRYEAGLPRGRSDFESVHFKLYDAFTLTASSFSKECPGFVTVAPAIMHSPRLSAFPQAVRPYGGMSTAKRPGEGSEFYGIREYSAGDRLRHLNWRAGALWGRDMINIFEGERAIDAGIILDCRADAYHTEAQFENAVSAALAVAEEFLDGGNRVAWLQYGSTLFWIPPGAGSAHRYRMRIAASSAGLGNHAVFERFDNLPLTVFPPASLVVLISPLLHDDIPRLMEIKAQGYSVSVIKPEAAEPDDGGEQNLAMARRLIRLEKRLLHTRLRRAGIAVLNWPEGYPLHAVKDPTSRRR